MPKMKFNQLLFWSFWITNTSFGQEDEGTSSVSAIVRSGQSRELSRATRQIQQEHTPTGDSVQHHLMMLNQQPAESGQRTPGELPPATRHLRSHSAARRRYVEGLRGVRHRKSAWNMYWILWHMVERWPWEYADYGCYCGVGNMGTDVEPVDDVDR